MSRVQLPQLTLAILKPDAHSCPITLWSIANLIVGKGFRVLESRKLHLTEAEASNFYYLHEGRFFYNRLIKFMSSGPISVHVLQRVDAVYLWRSLLGNTRVLLTQHSQPGTIRGMYGLTDTRNVAHGSDSRATADIEIRHFFPNFDLARSNYVGTTDLHKFLMQDFAHQSSLMKMLQKH